MNAKFMHANGVHSNWDLPKEIVNTVFEFVFDPESYESPEGHLSVRHCIDSVDACLIEYLWSMYVVSRCKKLTCNDCPCMKRAKCVFDMVLRESSRVEMLTPWCAKLKEVAVSHRSEDVKEGCGSLLVHLSKLDECALWDIQTLLGVYATLGSCGSSTAMCFLERVLPITTEHIHKIYFTLVLGAARNGHANIIEYLHRKTVTSLATAWNRRCLLPEAARYGHVNVLKFLHERLKLSREEARFRDNEALRQAARNGHVNVLEFLYEKWGLTAHDARSLDNEALLMATCNGHVNVLEYMHRTWRLTAEDARSAKTRGLSFAAKGGYVKVFEFLHTTWGLTAEDARSYNNCALRWAARNGHVTVLEHLHGKLGLTTKDAASLSNYALRFAARNGHIDVLNFLKTRWGLGPSH